jgi:predicted transcriptional regulator
MKAAISLPDNVFEAAEEMVQARGWTRSHLYTEAIREYLKRQDPDEITRRLDQVHGPSVDTDRATRLAANRKVFQASDW